jgi:uncharacterized integral membrane protein
MTCRNPANVAAKSAQKVVLELDAGLAFSFPLTFVFFVAFFPGILMLLECGGKTQVRVLRT